MWEHVPDTNYVLSEIDEGLFSFKEKHIVELEVFFHNVTGEIKLFSSHFVKHSGVAAVLSDLNSQNK